MNKQKAELEFEVTEYGPSGLGSVDVYVTTTEGDSWEAVEVDPHSILPVGDLKATGPVVGAVTVQLPKDGVTYGFYLVVKSRAGLGAPAPKSGDAPQIRIERDTTLPVAALYAPQVDPGRRDTLVLAWQAEDCNLAPNPVTLEWAAQSAGPWEFIGEAQLPNTGRYSWQVPPKTPAKVYLRLSVRDTAGNMAVAQTREPVLIDLFVPKVSSVRIKRLR